MLMNDVIQPQTSNFLNPEYNQKSVVTSLPFWVICILLFFGTSFSVLAATVNPVKWHPGHYMMLVNPGKDKTQYMQKVYTELNETPALRGVAMRYRWAELEKSKGVYDFSSIDRHLQELATRKKRLVILIETKSTNLDLEIVPSYLKNSTYEGGVFAFSGYTTSTIKGYNTKLWNNNVRDRLAALLSAMGKHLNANPYFEGIGLVETALGKPIVPFTTAQVNGYYDNLINLHQKMRQSFPTTMVFQFTNYPRAKLPALTNSLKTAGGALGCPDVFLEEPGLLVEGTNQGIYNYYKDLTGIIPLVVQIEESNYENTRFDGKGYQPTIGELLNFAKNQLKVNYLFWTRTPAYYSQVLEMLNQSGQKTTPSGGLSAACPSIYASCTK